MQFGFLAILQLMHKGLVVTRPLMLAQEEPREAMDGPRAGGTEAKDEEDVDMDVVEDSCSSISHIHHSSRDG